MQIIVHGASGRMGQLICAAAGSEVGCRARQPGVSRMITRLLADAL